LEKNDVIFDLKSIFANYVTKIIDSQPKFFQSVGDSLHARMQNLSLLPFSV